MGDGSFDAAGIRLVPATVRPASLLTIANALTFTIIGRMESRWFVIMINFDWQWPNDAQAAVSLTYDDGVDSHLDQAMPDLEAAGFRGSFYPTIGNDEFVERRRAWRDAFQRGHEIGNHTINHPCRNSRGKYNLKRYSPLDIQREVQAGADWLDEHIGSDPDRSFAYPCGHLAIGQPPDEDSYAEAVRRCHFAARTTERGVNDPQEVLQRPLHIKASLIDYPHAKVSAPLIEFCKQAVAARGWAVFGFHGIGDTWLPTDRLAHQQLIEHLRTGPYWLAPLNQVVRYIFRAK